MLNKKLYHSIEAYRLFFGHNVSSLTENVTVSRPCNRKCRGIGIRRIPDPKPGTYVFALPWERKIARAVEPLAPLIITHDK